VSQTNTTFCLWLDGPTYHDLLKPVTPAIGKRNAYLREAIVVPSVYYTTPLCH
jgi:hypothetical protein